MSSSYLFLYLILVYDSLKKKKKERNLSSKKSVSRHLCEFQMDATLLWGSKTGSRETNHPRFSPFYTGWGGRNGHIRRAQWKYWCDAGICLLCVQEFRTSRVFHFSSPLDEGDRQYLISKTKSFFVSIHALSDVHDEYVN